MHLKYILQVMSQLGYNFLNCDLLLSQLWSLAMSHLEAETVA